MAHNAKNRDMNCNPANYKQISMLRMNCQLSEGFPSTNTIPISNLCEPSITFLILQNEVQALTTWRVYTISNTYFVNILKRYALPYAIRSLFEKILLFCPHQSKRPHFFHPKIISIDAVKKNPLAKVSPSVENKMKPTNRMKTLYLLSQ